MRLSFTIAIAIAAAAPVAGQMVETHVTASNGVVIDRNADDFAGRFEYSAPAISIDTATGGGHGSALVAKIKRNGALGHLNIQGFVVYSGDWQYFSSAVFRGGEAVNYTRTSGEVGSCRYSCTLTENFSMELTPAQIAKYTVDGTVTVQLRASRTGNTALVNIPVKYIEAVNEVAR